MRSVKCFITSKQKQWSLLKCSPLLKKNFKLYSLLSKEISELRMPNFWGNVSYEHKYTGILDKLPKIAAMFNFLTVSLFEICINLFLFVKCINIVSIVTRDIATLKQMMLFF